MTSVFKIFAIFSLVFTGVPALCAENVPGGFLADYFDLNQNQIYTHARTFIRLSDRELRNEAKFDPFVDKVKADYHVLTRLNGILGISNQAGLIEMITNLEEFLKANENPSYDDIVRFINSHYTAKNKLLLLLLACLPRLDALGDQGRVITDLAIASKEHTLFKLDANGLLEQDLPLTINLLHDTSTINGRTFSILTQARKVVEAAPFSVSGIDLYPVLTRLQSEFTAAAQRYGVILRALDQRLNGPKRGSFFSSSDCSESFEFEQLGM